MVHFPTSPHLCMNRGDETLSVAAMNVVVPRARFREFAEAQGFRSEVDLLAGRMVEGENCFVEGDTMRLEFDHSDLCDPRLLPAIEQFAVPALTRVKVSRTKNQEWSLGRFLKCFSEEVGQPN